MGGGDVNDIDFFFGTLGVWIEVADTFYIVSEQIDTDGAVAVRRENIQNIAAPCEGTGNHHLIRATVTEGVK
ncbi:MAG: hypothetical protein WCP07_08615, partial [bacterium]